MKYYTIRMFSEGTVLETLTTKVAVDSMPDKTIKLLMESHDADEAEVYESTYCCLLYTSPSPRDS